MFTSFCACCLWLWLGPPPVLLRYVMYFSFVDDVMFFYNGLYSGMNFAMKDRFRLHLHVYHNV